MLMGKLLLSFFLLFYLFSGLKSAEPEYEAAYSWGVSAGYGYFSYSSDLRALPSVATKLPLQANGNFNGFYAGGIFILPVSRILSFQSGLYFYYETPAISAKMNSPVYVGSAETLGVTEHSIKTNMCNTRLELMARASLPFNFTLLGGLYAGYNHFNQNYEHTVKAIYPDAAVLRSGYKVDHPVDKEISTRFNTGFIAGFEYGIIKHIDYSVNLNFTYSLGMVNVAENFDWDAYAVKAGIVVLFNKYNAEQPERPGEQMACSRN